MPTDLRIQMVKLQMANLKRQMMRDLKKLQQPPPGDPRKRNRLRSRGLGISNAF